MKILVVDRHSLAVLGFYEDEGPNQGRFGGPFGDSSKTSHIICSPSIDPECAAAEDQDGNLVAILDEAKATIKEEKLWQDLRAERDVRLSKCDWTQLVDSPLNSQDKTAWANYRQELRDLPEHTEDPALPVWPEEPDQQI